MPNQCGPTSKLPPWPRPRIFLIDRGEAGGAPAAARRALHSGDERAVARQRERGKLLARERLEKLLDPGSFVELDRYVRHRNPHFGMMDKRPWGDAVVTGYGTIFGHQGLRLLQDFTVFGGTLSEVFAEKICRSWT